MEQIETRVVKPAVSFFENEVSNLIISTQEESNLDSKIQEIEDYMKNNSGKGKTEQEKDELYQNAQKLWHSYSTSLKEAKYLFYLNRPQYKFLTDLILTKMEYDVNTVFFAIELTDTMANMKDAKYTDDKGLNSFEVNATEITYIYHLISKHKVKGLSKDAYLFSQIRYRIGGISKMINYYEAAHKSLSSDIQNWVLTFEEGVEIESTPAKKAKKEKAVTE
jgi:uncharacterized protein YjaG (DUF416 family)